MSSPPGHTADGPRLRAQIVPLAIVGTIVAVVTIAAGLTFGLNPAFSIVLVAAIMGGAGVLLHLRRRTLRPPRADGRLGVGTVAAHVAVAGVATLALSQVVPYGRTHSNPPVTGEPAWSSPRTRELAVRACFGCHSNETSWPWYANIAPISWAVARHVDEGRGALNFSEFDRQQGDASDAVEVIRDGSMPPGYYTRFGRHPEAKLTDAEVAELIAGFEATPGLHERD